MLKKNSSPIMRAFYYLIVSRKNTDIEYDYLELLKHLVKIIS